MLGRRGDAEDAVQEAWLRIQRADASEVTNVGGWLTTVVARICLDMLRARTARREEPLGEAAPVLAPGAPDEELALADAIGPALMVVLDTLDPAERLAFVLHDMFGIPFDEIAPILGRTTAAARQLASRARRRVQGQEASSGTRAERHAVVTAFLEAARESRFEALLALLDPNVVARADAAVVRLGAEPSLHGAEAVARQFLGRAAAARVAIVDGEIGAAAVLNGKPRFVLEFTFRNGRIVGIDVHHDRATVAAMEIAMA